MTQFHVPLKAMLAACAISVAIAAPALAEDGRYQLQPAKDGVVRLDTRTGEMSFCTVNRKGELECVLAHDEKMAYEREIERIKAGEGCAGSLGDVQGIDELGQLLTQWDERDVDQAIETLDEALSLFLYAAKRFDQTMSEKAVEMEVIE